jgi:ABC-type Fe3+ transport system permease subunit
MLLTCLLLLPLGAAVASSSGYQEWWFAGRGWRILFNSCLFSLFAGAVATVGGYLVGRAGVGFAALACAPLAIPSSLLGSAWIVALGRNGLLGDWITVFDWPVASAVVGLRYVGIAAIIFATQRTAPGPAARVFTLRHAWWWLGIRPALAPAIAAWAATFLLVSVDHITPSMFLIHTYGTQVLIQYNALQDLPGAAALATPMLLPALIAIGIVIAAARPWNDSETSKPALTLRWPACLVVFLVLGVPLAAIVLKIDSLASLGRTLFEMRPEILRTTALALVSAPLCTAIGWLLAESWLGAWRRGRWSIEPLILINLVAPPSLLAMGLVSLFDRGPLRLFRDGDVPLITAYAARFVPIAMLVMFIVGLRRPTLPDRAAQLFDVPAWTKLRHILWPSRRAEITAVLVLTGLLIATELEASLLLVPAGTATVGVRLYTLIHTAPDSHVSAAAVGVLILLVPWIVLLGFLARRRRA